MPAEADVSVEALMDKASRVAGGRTWEDRSFLPTLELLVGSCQRTASLNQTGERVLGSIVVRHLANRLLIEAELAARPDVVRRPAGTAIVVTGLPRTGTTLLHNLLALDPRARVLRFWEALRPVPPQAEAGASKAELVRQAATWLERLYELVPCFRSIHGATAEGPEECDTLLQNDFASQHLDDMFNAVEYSAWLATAGLSDQYRSYARQLNVLRRPEDGSKPWMLKSPSHLGHLDALLAACPDTTIVHCHRHPSQAVPSYASLVLCLRRAYSDDVSPGTVGRQALERCVTALTRASAVRRAGHGTFLDVAYVDLVRRPLATVRVLYEQLGWELDPQVAALMSGWLASHPQHEHGVHRYAAEDFGLTTDKISRSFEAYLDGSSLRS